MNNKRRIERELSWNILSQTLQWKTGLSNCVNGWVLTKVKANVAKAKNVAATNLKNVVYNGNTIGQFIAICKDWKFNNNEV